MSLQNILEPNNYNIYINTLSPSNGILFQNSTVGYVPTLLNYYEEYDLTGDWSGLWGAGTLSTVNKIRRIGKIVTIDFDSAITASGGAGFLTFSTVIPDRFRPRIGTDTSVWQIACPIDDEGSSYNTGGFQITTSSGQINVYKDANQSNFSSVTGDSGLGQFAVTYAVI